MAVLAADEYMGRMPFTEGETKTIAYLQQQFKAIGLAPGNGDSFLQEVPMVNIEATAASTMQVQSPQGTSILKAFDDYAGLDVKGKVVLVMVNDPGFWSGDTTLFKGKEMTYYGRWTYKFEEAARQGGLLRPEPSLSSC